MWIQRRLRPPQRDQVCGQHRTGWRLTHPLRSQCKMLHRMGPHSSGGRSAVWARFTTHSCAAHRAHCGTPSIPDDPRTRGPRWRQPQRLLSRRLPWLTTPDQPISATSTTTTVGTSTRNSAPSVSPDPCGPHISACHRDSGSGPTHVGGYTSARNSAPGVLSSSRQRPLLMHPHPEEMSSTKDR